MFLSCCEIYSSKIDHAYNASYHGNWPRKDGI